MKKSYVALVILILVVLSFSFIMKTRPVEAPVVAQNQKSQPLTLAANTNTPVKEFTVKGTNFAFDPSTITVRKGDKVKITFKNENGFHDFKIDEFGAAVPKTQSPATEVLEFVADKAGSFEYYCSVGSHRMMGMKGTLVVQ